MEGELKVQPAEFGLYLLEWVAEQVGEVGSSVSTQPGRSVRVGWLGGRLRSAQVVLQPLDRGFAVRTALSDEAGA